MVLGIIQWGHQEGFLNKVKNSDDGKLDTTTEELATVLYNMALLNSGF